MPMFRVPQNFHIDDTHSIRMIDFCNKADLYEKRPPYQRKNVWEESKKKKLIDSILRGYFIPRIIIREVKVGERTFKYEIIDGQQRVQAIQDFFNNKFKTPENLDDIKNDISNKIFNDLPEEVKEFLKEHQLKATLIKAIDNPNDKNHQKLVAQIFWRLNDGAPLNRMEKDHSKIYSAVRNFIVKYADDISFDDSEYISKESNEMRHNFFEIINMDNKRLKHLALLCRFLMIEINEGFTDLGDKEVTKFIDRYEGTDLKDFENKKEVRNCIKNLNKFYDIFKDDIMIKGGSEIKELNKEYLIISLYLLLRHLEKYYTFENKIFRDFLYTFYQIWKDKKIRDQDILFFRQYRQQDERSVEERDVILRFLFFTKNPDLKLKDSRRSFNEAERIDIYRKNNGICIACKNAGKNDEEAFISWKDYEADHILAYIKGGETDEENAQLLCRRHNRIKGAK